jgi:hypothetical protein
MTRAKTFNALIEAVSPVLAACATVLAQERTNSLQLSGNFVSTFPFQQQT